MESRSCLIARENLTHSIMADIVRIYYEVAYGERVEEKMADWQFYSWESIFEYMDTKFGDSADYRYGSRLTIHSKLIVWNNRIENCRYFSFSFDPNMDNISDEARSITIKFRDQINKYLVDNKLRAAIPGNHRLYEQNYFEN